MFNIKELMADFMLRFAALASLYSDRSFSSAGDLHMYCPEAGRDWRCPGWPEMNLTRTTRLVAKAWTAWLILFCGLMLAAQSGFCGEEPAIPDSRVKALCLLNFAKYVDWPAEVFADTNSPIIIGVVGETEFEERLKDVMAERCVGGRKIEVVAAADEKDWRQCQILYIAASETKRKTAILKRVKSLPILTVGEAEPLTKDGGVIEFKKKSGKVRFEIDLNAAREAGLGISSHLLSLADTVQGKP